jgi:hypothetical protein
MYSKSVGPPAFAPVRAQTPAIGGFADRRKPKMRANPMPSTDPPNRNARAGPTEIRLSDRGSMFLAMTPASGRLWRFKHRIDGREKTRARLQADDRFKAIGDEDCQKRRQEGQKGRAPATASRSK